MTSTPNTSLNSSELLMDLSIKNFWLIVHYPHSDPDSEYEIVSNKDLVFDSWDVLQRCAMVTIKYGNAKLQGIVVAVSDDYDGLHASFDDHVQEYKDLKFETEKRQDDKNASPKSVRCLIKVADKGTQTSPEPKNTEYEALKRQYEDLQNKYNNLKAAVTEVKTDLQSTMLKLEVLNNGDQTATGNKPLQPISISENKENSKGMVEIGVGGTKIPRHIYNSIKWTNYSAATRKLLITLFPRSVLATHSLTGKPSPAFMSTKKTKRQLNATTISDVIEIVMRKCGVSESLVRNAITTKCADENKMYKRRLEKEGDAAADENDVKRTKMEL